MSSTRIGQVISSAPNSIMIEISDLSIFENYKTELQIGRYLKIAQGNNDFTIAVIMNLKGVNTVDSSNDPRWQFLIECQAIGTLVRGDKFERGSMLLPVPTEPVYIAIKDTLDKLFVADETYSFPFGKLSLNKEIDFTLNGDSFFSKHVAIVGSTGSGKSCTVAKILHDVVGIEEEKNINIGKQNNSHILIFDIHSEYKAAFSLTAEQSFTLNLLDVESLSLPYWLMNSEELESMFIESNEENSHNQVSQFKLAVIMNKEKYNPQIKEMTYDTPVYFSIEEVYRYIENMNKEVISRLAGENLPKLVDGTLVNDRKDHYFDKIQDFVSTSTAKVDKATNGPFNGQFNRFVSRLETRLNDKRLKFLLHPRKADGNPFLTDDFEEIMKQFIGYINKSNITVLDLSGIPFEVLSITVSLALGLFLISVFITLN